MSLGYKDPRWQQKRLERFSAANWTCQECCSNKVELNLHHYWYEKGNELWEYPDECFAVLCDKCHKDWHVKKQFIDKQLRLSLSEMDQVRGLIAGFHCHLNGLDFLFNPDMDAITITAVVRGFWPPMDYQRGILDECLRLASHNESFLLSDVVKRIVPMDEPKYGYMLDWVERASGVVNEG